MAKHARTDPAAHLPLLDVSSSVTTPEQNSWPAAVSAKNQCVSGCLPNTTAKARQPMRPVCPTALSNSSLPTKTRQGRPYQQTEYRSEKKKKTDQLSIKRVRHIRALSGKSQTARSVGRAGGDDTGETENKPPLNPGGVASDNYKVRSALSLDAKRDTPANRVPTDTATPD